MINANWDRWITAGINVHFKNAPEMTAKVILEGQPLDVPKEDRVEIRVDGPFYRKKFKNDPYEVDVEINVLITTVLELANSGNIYRQKTLVGIVTALFTTIPIYKCGNGPDDDASLLGCLKLKTDGNDPLEARNFGQIHQDLNIQQGIVEGHYQMELKGE